MIKCLPHLISSWSSTCRQQCQPFKWFKLDNVLISLFGWIIGWIITRVNPFIEVNASRLGSNETICLE